MGAVQFQHLFGFTSRSSFAPQYVQYVGLLFGWYSWVLIVWVGSCMVIRLLFWVEASYMYVSTVWGD